MSLKWFICPDGQRCEVTECYEKCRMAQRCAPRAYLRLVGQERKWTGKPSVTQLIGGSRQAYLELTTDYAIDPSEATYRIIGTRAHAKLENHEDSKTIMEDRLEFEGITGAFDQLEFEHEKINLIDTKTSGSYKVAKALGYTTEKNPIPITDDQGNLQFYKTGARKGQQKTKQETRIIKGEPDMHDWVLQQNIYRIMVESALNEDVNNMFIFALPRDGGTFTAKNRGIEKNMYMIPVKRLEDNEVIKYFMTKKIILLNSLQTKEAPAICSTEECWDGRKCSKYCPVKDACCAVGDNNYITEEEK